jgi:flavin reductase (DIM6/NTAB) family NADH-FMN oxidoreductase RutF
MDYQEVPMIFEFSRLSPLERYKLLSSTIVPRPIAWVSTRSPDGVANAAPFSFFNVFGEEPPVVGFSINDRRPGDRKDTGNNIRHSGDFVVNLVSDELLEQMNITAAEFNPAVDEFQEAGLSVAPSLSVDAPRIAESPVSLECKLLQIVDLGAARSLFLGLVQVMHVADRAILNAERFHIDTPELRLVGRMQGNWYVRTAETMEVSRVIPDETRIAR